MFKYDFLNPVGIFWFIHILLAAEIWPVLDYSQYKGQSLNLPIFNPQNIISAFI